MNDLRISYIDQLKGIAILLVVLGHVIGYNNCEDSFLWRFIYSFHMPLFMFISGYVAQMTFRIERFGWNETISFLIKKLFIFSLFISYASIWIKNIVSISPILELFLYGKSYKRKSI